MNRFKILITGIFLLFYSAYSFSQTTDDYRTISSGSWTNIGIWQRYNGTGPAAGRGWFAATAFPTSANRVISIRSGHSVNVPTGASLTIDQVQVLGSLLVDAGGIVSIANGTPGINVNTGGIITVSGTVSLQNTATWTGSTIANTTFQSGSRYIHGWTSNEGIIPLATWNTGSVTEIAGYTASITCTAAGNWNQAFYDVEINLTGLTNSGREVNFRGRLNSITNNLNVISTGGATGGRIRMSGGVSNATMTIGGNLITSANTRTDITNGATGVILNVNGIVSNAGTISMAAVNTGISTLNVKGNFSNLAGGTITTISTTTTATAGIGTINFNGTSVQQFSNGGTMTNHVRVSIPAGSIVDVGTSAITGTGTFTLSGELRVGSTNTNGAIQLSTGAGSNLQNTGTRTFNSGSTIHYNGAALQYIGNGYSPIAATGVNLVINNTSGVTVAAALAGVEVTGNLILTNGAFNISGMTLTLDGNIIQNSAASTITVNTTSDITINGSGPLGTFPFAAGAQSFRNLTLNRVTSGSVAFANPLTIVGAVVLTNGRMIFNGQSLTLTGTFSAGSGFLSSDAAATLIIGGAGALGNLVFDPANNQLLSLTMNRTGSGTATLNGTLQVNSALNLLNGDFTQGGGLTAANGLILTRSSTSQLLGARLTISAGAYNVFYQGAALTSGLELPDPLNTGYLNNLTINGGTVSLNQDLTINGDFTANIADMNGGNVTITMKGANWNLTGGAFTPSTSTVIFDGNTTVNGISVFNHIISAGTVNFNNPVTVNGDLTNSGSLSFSPTSMITFSGSSDQTVSGNAMTIGNMVVNKSATTLINNSNVELTGELTMTNGTFDADGAGTGIFTLNSDAMGDAAIGVMATGTSITGEVTFERFFNNTTNRWRNLAFPVTGVTYTELGSSITLSTGSLATYTESVPGDVNQGWNIISGGTLNNAAGHSAWMYTIQPITISVRGPLLKGVPALTGSLYDFGVTYTDDPTQPASEDGWNFIPNPFASPIDWDNAGWVKTNVNPQIAVWDEQAGVYRYTSIDWDGVIAQGQAFWVQTNGSTPVLTGSENVKVSNSNPAFYRKSAEAFNSRLLISLKSDLHTDKALVQYRKESTPEFDREFDAYKLKNPIFNISTLTSEGVALAANNLPKTPCTSSIKMNITNIEPGTYALNFEGLETFVNLNSVTLIDNFQEESRVIAMDEGYTFEVTSDGKSYGADRFHLVFNFTDQVAGPVIEKEGTQLVSNFETGNQWYFNNEPLAGVTGNRFTPSQQGTYHVVVNNGQCELSSDHIVVEKMLARVYPNPATTVLKVDVQNLLSGADNGELLLHTTQGQLMRREIFRSQDTVLEIQVSDLKPGVYILAITTGNGIVLEKTKVILK